ncbi:MAG TPA: hypothetical protein VE861_06970, partial [Gemmatimonadaceae bacterium]|nr:hypothetical protein [Gemmatimonadaceae bacterium]
ANAAIGAGDDAALDAALEERGLVIAAAIAACQAAVADGASHGVREGLLAASQVAVTGGEIVRANAERVRGEVVSELAALDARQQASMEYQPVAPHGRIDVVL